MARTKDGIQPDGAFLPGLLVGDVAVPQGRHEWPGWLFIGYCYFLAALTLFLAVSFAIQGRLDEPRPLMFFVFSPVIALGSWRLAAAVRSFSSRGFYGAMLQLAIFAGAKVVALAGEGIIAGLILSVFEFAWMWYFWKRRAQFGIDFRS
jgi:hypothetical protein